MNDTEELKNEINSLLTKLEAHSREGGADASVLYHLKLVLTALDSDPQRVGMEIGKLKAYWLRSIAWCSALSKDIEKVLIMYEDTLTGH